MHVHIGTGVWIAVVLIVAAYVLDWPSWAVGIIAFIGVLMLGLPVWVALIAGLVFWRYG